MKGFDMSPKSLSVTMWMVLAICIIVLSIGIIPVRDVKKDKKLVSENLDLANRLRKEGLYDAAIKEYNNVLNSRFIPDSDKANISVLVANLYFDDLKDSQKALEFYTRAKFYSKDTLKDRNVDQRIVECLEKLNRSVDAQNQLDKSTHVENTEQKKFPGAVVATIGKREITMGELDEAISKLPRFRREMIKTPEDKFKFLNEYVSKTVMAKAAKRKGLDKDQDYLFQIADIEEQLLANTLYQKEISEKIQITDVERKYYYQSNKDKFSEPRKIKLAHIQLKEKSEAEAVASELKKGKNFDELAKEKSTDEKTKDNGGIIGDVAEGAPMIPGIGNEPGAAEIIASLDQGKISDPVQTSAGWSIFKAVEIIPEKKKDYEEVKDIVENQLRNEKENGIKQNFITELMKTEQVNIFDGAFNITKEQKTETKDEIGAESKK